jgi:hypothetical protein
MHMILFRQSSRSFKATSFELETKVQFSELKAIKTSHTLLQQSNKLILNKSSPERKFKATNKFQNKNTVSKKTYHQRSQIEAVKTVDFPSHLCHSHSSG